MHIGINAHLLSFASTYRQAGLSRHIHELLIGVPGVAPDLRVTAYVGSEPVPGDFLRKKPSALRLRRSKLPTGRAPVRILWEQSALPIVALTDRLDLLHCPVSVRPWVAPCPVVVTVHDLIFLRYPERFHPAKQRYLSVATRWSVHNAAHVIAVSEATRQDVRELLGVPANKVTAVPNGVGEQFRPLPGQDVDAFRARHGLNGRVLLYVGTLEPRKNLPILLEAFANLQASDEFDDVTLVIGGSKGWYYNEIFEAAERLQLAAKGRVRFLGRVPDEELGLWYNVATAFVYPSLYEGFGLPPAEAMACGTPVAVSNSSSLPEVVRDAGLIVNPDDREGWEHAISKLLRDPELRRELSAKGRLQAAQFTWDRTARETVAVYRKVLERQSKGR